MVLVFRMWFGDGCTACALNRFPRLQNIIIKNINFICCKYEYLKIDIKLPYIYIQYTEPGSIRSVHERWCVQKCRMRSTWPNCYDYYYYYFYYWQQTHRHELCVKIRISILHQILFFTFFPFIFITTFEWVGTPETLDRDRDKSFDWIEEL